MIYLQHVLTGQERPLAEFIHKINWIDVLIVIVLARSSYIGFSKGFGGEVFRFVCYVGAVIGAVYYYEFASQLISDYLPALYPVSTLIGFTGIYLAILIASKLITILIDRIIKIEALNAVNK
ncbi:MAG: CvpA family protein [Candidatus Omnitrophica bacterium]|nr:CvpA family protein [Candidatus Omnitrophota bacterium]